MTEMKGVDAVIETALGEVGVRVYPERAPIASANFLAYVDGGHLMGGSIYRIVTLANDNPATPHKIEVIQWGWTLDTETPLPRIAHEPTSQTGLTHQPGTLSMARRELGTAGPGFVFCVGGDLPSLDEGGGRNPDGHGFTAFGEIISGWDVIGRIMERAEAGDRIANRIPILGARRR